MTETSLNLVFYFEDTIGSLLVRKFTRKRNQNFKDVPGHVGVLIGEDYYEAISTGVRTKTYDYLGECRKVKDLKEEEYSNVKKWLDAQLGKPYDWWAILADIVGFVLPKRGRISSTTQERWDCSRLVAGALAARGRETGAGRTPVSPNDLWLMAQSWAGAGETEKDGK